MPEMTDQDLTELKGLMEKATPGHWFWNSYSAVFTADPDIQRAQDLLTDGARRDDQLAAESRICSVPPHHGDTAVGRQAADAELIAKLRNHAPALIRAKEREQVYRNALVEIAKETGTPYARTAQAALDFDAQGETQGDAANG